MRLRRLESEAIRDALLAVSGKLDQTMGGPPVLTETRPDGMVVVAEKGLPSPAAKWRRSLYLLNRRIYHLTLLSVFDQPVVAGSCCRRDSSAVALQSLSLLNDRLVIEQAVYCARRLADLAGASAGRRIDLAFRAVLARRPVPAEARWAGEFLDSQTKLYQGAKLSADEASVKALAHLCQTLFNTNEFVYIE